MLLRMDDAALILLNLLFFAPMLLTKYRMVYSPVGVNFRIFDSTC